MASRIEQILTDTKTAFVTAKADGKLEATEVIQIAMNISQKIHTLAGLDSAQKEALVFLCLKKGLVASGGLALDAVAEDQILKAGVAAAKALVPVKACFPFCYRFVAVVEKLLPNDAALIEEALELLKAPLPNIVVSIPESVTAVKAELLVREVELAGENIVLHSIPEEEPSPVA